MFFTQQRGSDPATSDAPAPAIGSAMSNGLSLRIATYNIHKGVSALARRNRIHDMRAGLHRLSADVVFLQEVQGRNERHARRFANWPQAAQHDFLADARWLHAVYGRNAVHSDKDHGNALLSRFPLIAADNLDVSDHRFEQRGLLHCVLQLGPANVHCICVHLGLFEKSRTRQAQAIIARIRSAVPDDAPLIVAGDMNDWRNRLGEMFQQQLGLVEVFDGLARPRVRLSMRMTVKQLIGAASDPARPARTYPAALPLLRLDRVYVRGFTIRGAQVMSGVGWEHLSDHAPLVADLWLPS
jgi:endonuclease/exonuclease/phosphatase family metal-dependent hydrolase